MTSSGLDARKQERDEKRIARQKELEAKRAAKKGPLKLGAKKLLTETMITSNAFCSGNGNPSPPGGDTGPTK